MKAVQDFLRHSSITITADTYTSVLPEIARAAAEKTAGIVPRRTRPTKKPPKWTNPDVGNEAAS